MKHNLTLLARTLLALLLAPLAVEPLMSNIDK